MDLDLTNQENSSTEKPEHVSNKQPKSKKIIIILLSILILLIITLFVFKDNSTSAKEPIIGEWKLYGIKEGDIELDENDWDLIDVRDADLDNWKAVCDKTTITFAYPPDGTFSYEWQKDTRTAFTDTFGDNCYILDDYGKHLAFISNDAPDILMVVPDFTEEELIMTIYKRLK